MSRALEPIDYTLIVPIVVACGAVVGSCFGLLGWLLLPHPFGKDVFWICLAGGAALLVKLSLFGSTIGWVKKLDTRCAKWLDLRLNAKGKK